MSGSAYIRLLLSKNFETVYSAWDNDKLVGMICAMDDGIMTAYVHYLLVNPKYQGMKIGRTLVDTVKQKYRDYLRIAIIAYDDEVHFYENCGFKKSDNPKCPLKISKRHIANFSDMPFLYP